MTEQRISLSQFADLLALPEQAVRCVTFSAHDSSVTIFLEEQDMAQSSGTCPPLHDNTSTRKPKGKAKR